MIVSKLQTSGILKNFGMNKPKLTFRYECTIFRFLYNEWTTLISLSIVMSYKKHKNIQHTYTIRNENCSHNSLHTNGHNTWPYKRIICYRLIFYEFLLLVHENYSLFIIWALYSTDLRKFQNVRLTLSW